MDIPTVRSASVLSVAAFAICACSLSIRDNRSPAASDVQSQVLDAIANDDPSDEAFRYRIGWTDLDADGHDEAVVLMVGDVWCGTGGCTLFVVDHVGPGWKVVSSVVAARPPVAALASVTEGWRDLVVTEVGGGLLEPHRTVLAFGPDGYAKRPELEAHGREEVLIATF